MCHPCPRTCVWAARPLRGPPVPQHLCVHSQASVSPVPQLGRGAEDEGCCACCGMCTARGGGHAYPFSWHPRLLLLCSGWFSRTLASSGFHTLSSSDAPWASASWWPRGPQLSRGAAPNPPVGPQDTWGGISLPLCGRWHHSSPSLQLLLQPVSTTALLPCCWPLPPSCLRRVHSWRSADAG